MALSDVRLSLLTFPQSWDAGVLTARLLLLPVGDPEASNTTTFRVQSENPRSSVELGNR